ncbi:TetR family transcriptional regulator [Taklimakanibacter lacteus]|uniref:TetR family transcriptional regulator n=1 Tax=Taklimakanibacter lacteus TaxID=2268456 RepID=UPI000E660244
MPRPKTQTDEEVLKAAHRLIHAEGPQALSFARLARYCGLAPATLVQRFKSKPGLMQATLLFAWDKLDARTAELAAALPRTPEGAIHLLVGLSGSYGGIEAYADGLLILREDLRDPALRARGTAWRRALAKALNECFAAIPDMPKDVGLLMASQWQGSLLWWGFDPKDDVERFVETGLRRFVAAMTR